MYIWSPQKKDNRKMVILGTTWKRNIFTIFLRLKESEKYI